MSHEPKRRHSKERKGKRRASIKLQLGQSIVCPNCKFRHVSHIICPQCGFYNGKEVIAAKKTTTTTLS
ncbi:MAG TPA: 50S ribosomal protein L32 [Patescibacteria group bacterium]|nr:50S ribosomal protein L32 [Patescibacteria group bacterium]